MSELYKVIENRLTMTIDVINTRNIVICKVCVAILEFTKSLIKISSDFSNSAIVVENQCDQPHCLSMLETEATYILRLTLSLLSMSSLLSLLVCRCRSLKRYKVVFIFILIVQTSLPLYLKSLKLA